MKQRSQVNVVQEMWPKIFDKVWHLDLKLKIIRLKLPMPFTKLISDFLEVSSTSEAASLTSGIPWGSCLLPILFTIYIVDLPEPSQGSSHYIYANDNDLTDNHI